MGAAGTVTAGRVLRGCSGALAAGLAILLVVLLGSWVAAVAAGTPGPGGLVLLGHTAAAGLAGVLQRVADRRRGPAGLFAAAGVAALTAGVVSVFWWS
ncbi:MAG TPA: hypothetical protein VGM60_08705 [Pseudonocardia sp.]|jgi:hypothetical protein